MGGAMNTDARKLSRSMASACCFCDSSSRPRFQVIMSANTTPPISSGNQPPANSLSRLELKKARSTTKKKPVASRHSHSGYFQP
ncbi:hypothetical protein D9M68_978910 [compost metagenome]